MPASAAPTHIDVQPAAAPCQTSDLRQTERRVTKKRSYDRMHNGTLTPSPDSMPDLLKKKKKKNMSGTEIPTKKKKKKLKDPYAAKKQRDRRKLDAARLTPEEKNAKKGQENERKRAKYKAKNVSVKAPTKAFQPAATVTAAAVASDVNALASETTAGVLAAAELIQKELAHRERGKEKRREARAAIKLAEEQNPQLKAARLLKNRIYHKQWRVGKAKQGRDQERERARLGMQRIRQHLPDSVKDWNTDPEAARRFLHSMCEHEVYPSELLLSNEQELQKLQELLKPITEEERTSQLKDFRSVMNKHCPMYGCASCGIRALPFNAVDVSMATDPQSKFKIPIANIWKIFQVQEDKMESIRKQFGSSIVLLKVERKTAPLALHRRFIVDDSEILALYDQFQTISPNAIVFLCPDCAALAAQKKTADLCLATGWDFGWPSSPAFKLPALSFLELLLIQRVRVFSHVAKLVDGKASSSFAVSGHCLAIPTDAAERVAEFRAFQNSASSLTLPRHETNVQTCGLSVMFIGTLDRWEKLLSDNGPNRFSLTTVYKRIFHVQWESIMFWLHFLKHNSPVYKDIVISPEDDVQMKEKLEKLPLEILAKAHIADTDIVAELEERTRVNHPRAPNMSDVELDGVADSDDEIVEDYQRLKDNPASSSLAAVIPEGEVQSILVEATAVDSSSPEEEKRCLKSVLTQLEPNKRTEQNVQQRPREFLKLNHKPQSNLEPGNRRCSDRSRV